MLQHRGLHQGDLLSLYIFIICAEGLSALFKRAEVERAINRVKVYPCSPPISHILFADNFFFFLLVTVDECNSVKCILS